MSKLNNAVSVSDTISQRPAANITLEKDDVKTFMYIGPSLTGNAKLMANALIKGRKSEIKEYYKDVFAAFPNVERLIVPTDKVAEVREKIKAGGNVLSKYYNDLAKQVREGSVK